MTSNDYFTALPDDPSGFLTEIRPELLKYCRSLTGREWEAEDLVQDTIFNVLKRLGKEPAISLSKPYVFRSARNLWIDRCRSRSRKLDIPFEDLEELPAQSGTDALITRELLEEMMHRLMPKSFVIVLLCDVFGMTAKEAGGCIQMAEGSVQVALSRARKRLRLLAIREKEKDEPDARKEEPDAGGSIARLLESVTSAFRRQDPRLIYEAYLHLFVKGFNIAGIRSQDGRFYFTIRDPDGNLFMVSE